MICFWFVCHFHVFFCRYIYSFIWSTLLIYPFGFVVAFVKLLFLLIYHSNVMLLTTVLTINLCLRSTISTYVPFITSSHPFFSFLFHSFIRLFMTTPVVKNVDNACRIYVMYNLMALNDWLFRITHIPMIPIPFFCVCVCLCYGFCNWIQSDFLQFAFVTFLNLFHSFCTGFWRWHLSHFILKMLLFRCKIFTRSFT